MNGIIRRQWLLQIEGDYEAAGMFRTPISRSENGRRSARLRFAERFGLFCYSNYPSPLPSAADTWLAMNRTGQATGDPQHPYEYAVMDSDTVQFAFFSCPPAYVVDALVVRAQAFAAENGFCVDGHRLILESVSRQEVAPSS